MFNFDSLPYWKNLSKQQGKDKASATQEDANCGGDSDVNRFAPVDTVLDDILNNDKLQAA